MIQKNFRVESILGGSLRLAERCLPHVLLRLLLLPPSAALALLQLTRSGPRLRQFLKLPPSIQPQGHAYLRPWRLWRRRTSLAMTKFVRYWPDRLPEARWQARCLLPGVERLDTVHAASRSAILATFHYGNLDELHHWLRARGLMAAILTAADLSRVSEYRAALNRARDVACGLSGIPRLFHVGQLWDARDFLSQPGRVLIVAVDAWSRNNLVIRGDDCDYLIAPGALRLAAITGAAVIPCLIRSPRGLTSTIEFGVPVPDSDLADPSRHAAACEHIVRELLPMIRALPEQCDGVFLHHCLRPLAPEPA